MIRYGRPEDGTKPMQSYGNHDAHTAAGRILALGCGILAGFLITMTVPWHTGRGESALTDSGLPVEGVVAVMSTAVQERESLERPMRNENNTADVVTEPFGYLDGEWNLWEYIGDLMWSLLS
ncbi:MAG: hypothetical protein IKY52_11520 [Clostridia bacterium]|nr:hypothetical protein [Clostridia bacterium]